MHSCRIGGLAVVTCIAAVSLILWDCHGSRATLTQEDHSSRSEVETTAESDTTATVSYHEPVYGSPTGTVYSAESLNKIAASMIQVGMTPAELHFALDLLNLEQMGSSNMGMRAWSDFGSGRRSDPVLVVEYKKHKAKWFVEKWYIIDGLLPPEMLENDGPTAN